MIYIILYFIIGIFVSIYFWKKDYEEEYNQLKENGECEESMAIILLLFILIFWPIKFIIELINYIRIL